MLSGSTLNAVHLTDRAWGEPSSWRHTETSVLCQKSVNIARRLGVGWLGPGLSGVMGGLNRLSNKGVLLRVR